MSEARTFVERVGDSMGAAEIIFGALTLYNFWLWVRDSSVPALFPATNQPAVDVFLLLLAAWMTGKVLSLLIVVVIASVELLQEKKDFKNYYSSFEDALKHYCLVRKMSLEGVSETQRRLFARELIAGESPKRQHDLRQIRERVVTAYSGAFLAMLYSAYLGTRVGSTYLMGILIVGSIILLVTGLFEQWSELLELKVSLKRLAQSPPGGEHEIKD